MKLSACASAAAVAASVALGAPVVEPQSAAPAKSASTSGKPKKTEWRGSKHKKDRPDAERRPTRGKGSPPPASN